MIALWQYLGLLTLSSGVFQARSNNRYGRLLSLPQATCGKRWGEKVGTNFGTHAVVGFNSGGEQISSSPARQWR